jgi:hypothetical protein
LGIRTAIVGVCSNESGIENSRIFISTPRAFVRPGRDGLGRIATLCLRAALNRWKAPVSQI